MSRSYRLPYSAITGTSSAAYDKMQAARGVRRAQNQALRNFQQNGLDWDDFIIPIKLECSWNETYSWHRDGKQSLQFPPKPIQEGHYGWLDEQEKQEVFQKYLDGYQKLFRK